jgi:hypothetical protein
MLQYSILPQLNIITSHGVNYIIQMLDDPKLTNIHAIQINDDNIHVEFLDGTPVKWDATISDYQYIIDVVEKLKNVPDASPTFDEVKETTWRNIKMGLSNQLSQGFSTNGVLMNACLHDIQQLITITTVANLTAQHHLDIVDLNNVVQPNISIDVVNSMVGELGKNYQVLFNKKQTLRAAINAATTIKELQKIVW